MNPEENHDPVWELLKRSPKPAAREDFLAQVMDSVRGVPQDPAAPERSAIDSRKIRHFPTILGWAAAAAVVVGLAVWQLGPRPAAEPTNFVVQPHQEEVSPPEMEIVALESYHELVSIQDLSVLADDEVLALLQ